MLVVAPAAKAKTNTAKIVAQINVSALVFVIL
jgi:hypothetical protein